MYFGSEHLWHKLKKKFGGYLLATLYIHHTMAWLLIANGLNTHRVRHTIDKNISRIINSLKGCENQHSLKKMGPRVKFTMHC